MFDVIRGKSLLHAPGETVVGAFPAQMSWQDTKGLTAESNPTGTDCLSFTHYYHI